jgi:hypothetical protein
MPARSSLMVAVGVAAGVATASLSPRSAAPTPPPQIEVNTGHVEGGGTLRVLVPQSIRVGDQITRLGPSSPATPERALVYLDVNGVPVLIALAFGPDPGVPSPPSDFPPRPVPDDGVMPEALAGLSRSMDLAPAVLTP